VYQIYNNWPRFVEDITQTFWRTFSGTRCICYPISLRLFLEDLNGAQSDSDKADIRFYACLLVETSEKLQCLWRRTFPVVRHHRHRRLAAAADHLPHRPRRRPPHHLDDGSQVCRRRSTTTGRRPWRRACRGDSAETAADNDRFSKRYATVLSSAVILRRAVDEYAGWERLERLPAWDDRRHLANNRRTSRRHLSAS